jgi:hypothetical protein
MSDPEVVGGVSDPEVVGGVSDPEVAGDGSDRAVQATSVQPSNAVERDGRIIYYYPH